MMNATEPRACILKGKSPMKSFIATALSLGLFACCGALRGRHHFGQSAGPHHCYKSVPRRVVRRMMMADVGKPERRVIVVPEEKPVSVPIPDQPKPVKAPEKEPA